MFASIKLRGEICEMIYSIVIGKDLEVEKMSKLLCVLNSFCFIILLVSSAFGGERVYDFSNDDAWEAISATWEIVDGEYVKTDPDTSTAGVAVLKASEGIDTKDVETIEVMAWDLGTGPWQNLTIVFGFDESEPLSYQAGPFVGGAQAWRVQTFNSANRSGIATVQTVGDTLGPGKWYHIKVVFEGDTAILYGAEEGKDLEEKTRYDFPQGKPSGRIGLGGNGANAKYDNFKVTGPEVEALAVESKGKLSAVWGDIKEQ
jgi:hypothetical protein